MRWSVMLILLLGCGAEIQQLPDATTDSGDADMNDSSDAISDAVSPIAYDVVDGGGDAADAAYCYPDGDIVQACCNGQYCQGFCLRLDDGGIGCSCYGVAEGCTGMPEAVCCSLGRGCVNQNYCGGGTQH